MAKRFGRIFSCPVELTLEILDGKWTPVLLDHLKRGPRRFGELRALVPRLSDKMLTERLRDLEERGLVIRTVTGDQVRHPIYELTMRGNSLRPVLHALCVWGEGAAPELGVTVELTARARRCVAGDGA